ncbi:pyridoxamine 5'-phosphate oxidase family protein [Streptomyces sp. NPDC058067]|uniref:pyridoxamine 5'-phosphate oxidase family protein n=1 Tax=Streptomyces sp. NPDC058067 TaxID=3346324 RepID=UPI0036E8DA5B
MYPRDGIREIDRQECLRLLATAHVGRIVHTHHALPAVLPVAFSLDDDFSVVVRTSALSPLANAIDQAVVAFQTDEVDPATASGWSVLVTGRATVVTDPEDHVRLSRTGPPAWRSSRHDVFFRIEPVLVTGSALGAKSEAPEGALKRALRPTATTAPATS